MGIRGLTTFIQSRSNVFMEKYELHDTYLVLDGNSIACQLYRWHTHSNDCFGGDYDQYANVIANFFKLLFDCGVTPYVVFDGGYEKRKVATVISRMKNKIKSAEQLNGVTESSISVFPLLLRITFLDTVKKLNIKIVRCDFEGDSEIASIARLLNCPVLSYDSDFYIFDVLYIPFSTLDMSVRKGRFENSSELYKYIPCEVYKVENFLKCFEGLKKSSLPILAVLLGNDYVKRSVFSLFFQNLKMQKCKSPKEEQKRIKSLIIWLQNETIETAIEKVLCRYKKDKRNFILDKIQIAIKGYNDLNSKCLAYLDLILPVPVEDNVIISIGTINDEQVTDYDEESEVDSDSKGDSTSCNESDEEGPLVEVPSIFLEKFRRCQYSPSFMNILLHHKCYCEPQVELSALPNAHVVSFDILAAIHKILTNSDEHLTCIGRVENEQVGRKIVSPCDIDLPTFLDIPSLDVNERKDIVFRTLKLNESFVNSLQTFPSSWHLFIITIKYLMTRSMIGWPLIYSLLLCTIILKHVDKKIGFYRSVKEFHRKFGMGNKPDQSDDRQSTNSARESITQALEDIAYNDCKACMRALIPLFEIDAKTTTNRSFDRNLVHSISQFQSCLMHVGQLNDLLNLPFPSVLVSECLNCTFLYNLTTNFNKRTNLDEYIKILLQNSPSILHSYSLITARLKESSSNDVLVEGRPKKRRRKKKKDITIEEIDELLPDTDEEMLLDPNNKFAVLSSSINY